jgi:hypothetical protein
MTPAEKQMSLLTLLIFLATAANVWVFYLESEDTSKQVKTLSEKAGEIVGTMNKALSDNQEAVKNAFEQNKTAVDASTKQSARALSASIDATRNDQRSWVGTVSFAGADYTATIGGVTRAIFLSEGQQVRFGANFQNSGKTPAVNFAPCVTFDIVEAATTFVPRKCVTSEKVFSVLQPNTTGTVWTEAKPGFGVLTRPQLQALGDGTTRC